MQSPTAVSACIWPCITGAICLAFASGVAGRTGLTSGVARVATGVKSGFRCAALPVAMSLVLVAVICATSTSAVNTGGWWITAMGGIVYSTTVAPSVWSRRTHRTHHPSDHHRRASDGDDDKARFRRSSSCIHMYACVWVLMGSNMPWGHWLVG